jgi:hypothetical protein
MNYSEQLAYWYFRLNGFFLITDFVNHRNDNHVTTHDTDLLAVKMPFTSEAIGGDYLDEYITGKIHGVIVEVKSGQYSASEVLNNQDILRESINRLGLLEEQDIDTSLAKLQTESKFENDSCIIEKILICSNQRRGINPGFRLITLENVLRHIESKKQIVQKNSDRLFFNSELIQFIFSNTYLNESE